VQAFEQDRVVILKKICDQLVGFPAADDIRLYAESGPETRDSGVIQNLLAKLIQFLRPVPAGIFKAMQMDFNTQPVECGELVEHVDDAAIIGRIRDVE
jgi:hypothetical protein